VIDYGLSVANQHATEALADAASAANAASPITAYGIVGKDDPNYSPKDTNGYPKWNGTSYGLILGNS